ncbi:MAG: tRNA epoxyqueuosine(34) reductase QueG [Thermoanaerobaculia bacterium]
MSRDRTELVKCWALEAGFDVAGVARLEPMEHGEAYVRWLERGDQADMEWLERRLDVRLDPRNLLRGAASVLCVGMQYWPLAGECEPTGALWSRVARYARGEDYHRAMERRLDGLGARIASAFPGTRWRRYVDTGPLLERELAARAGLGSIGKNTLLLNREHGSWLLLGELILTLDLAPDTAGTDLCGACTACLEACPTGALREPYRLDSNLCISYWTIERRGALPAAAREALQDWVFGCDICQEVCPWNRDTPPARHDELRLPEARRELTLEDLLNLSRDEYVRRFRHSPMKRAKREGLRRNAAVALGNRGRREAVPALTRALDAESPVVRSHAAWALDRLDRDHRLSVDSAAGAF